MMDVIASFDMRVLEALYAVRDPVCVQAFIWITELGSTTVISGLTICTVLILGVRGHIGYLSGIIVTVAGSEGTVFLLKELFERARPDAVFQAYLETGFSFPSGHTALSFAFYGFLAWMLWNTVSSKKLRIVSLIVLAILVPAIGFSRLYLGVHWMSDVLASYFIAGFFLWLGIVVAKKLRTSKLPLE